MFLPIIHSFILSIIHSLIHPFNYFSSLIYSLVFFMLYLCFYCRTAVSVHSLPTRRYFSDETYNAQSSFSSVQVTHRYWLVESLVKPMKCLFIQLWRNVFFCVVTKNLYSQLSENNSLSPIEHSTLVKVLSDQHDK